MREPDDIEDAPTDDAADGPQTAVESVVDDDDKPDRSFARAMRRHVNFDDLLKQSIFTRGVFR